MIEVLIIKPSSLGDILHTAPGVERIALSRADCRVTWLVNDEYASFVREFPGVSAVIPFSRRLFRLRRLPSWFGSAASMYRALRRGFDVAVDLQGLQRSALMARWSGARERFGPRESRELAWIHYNRRISIPRGLRHAVDRLEHMVTEVLRVSAYLGGARHATGQASTRWRAPRWARSEVEELLGGDTRAPVVLCPGTRWPSKLWTGRRWAELILQLERDLPGMRPVLIGAPGEQGLAREALDQARAAGARSRPLDLVGRLSLWQTAALVEGSAAVVAMDSAPLHMAALAGAPTVSLFGPTDPERVGPRGSSHRILQRQLDCIACYERQCPLPRRVCLPEITAEEVIAALVEVARRGR